MSQNLIKAGSHFCKTSNYETAFCVSAPVCSVTQWRGYIPAETARWLCLTLKFWVGRSESTSVCSSCLCICIQVHVVVCVCTAAEVIQIVHGAQADSQCLKLQPALQSYLYEFINMAHFSEYGIYFSVPNLKATSHRVFRQFLLLHILTTVFQFCLLTRAQTFLCSCRAWKTRESEEETPEETLHGSAHLHFCKYHNDSGRWSGTNVSISKPLSALKSKT